MVVCPSIAKGYIPVNSKGTIDLGIAVNIQIKINVKIICDINSATNGIDDQISCCCADFVRSVNTNSDLIGSDVR